MPATTCPFCSKGVTLPDPWTALAYTCPHCRQTVSTTAPPPPPPPAPRSKPAPAPLDFDDEYETPSPRRSRRSYGGQSGPGWLTIFTATLLANVLAGVILLMGVRFYVYWSIQDGLEKLNKPSQPAGR